MTWYLKQLLPLSYATSYRDASGRARFVTWRMWFGRCFDVVDVEVVSTT